MDLRHINKADFGKKLVPKQIYKFKYHDELEELYQKLYFDNVRYSLIANLFALSVILSIPLFLYVYDYVYNIFNDAFYVFAYKVLIIFITWFLVNLFTYYLVLFAYYFVHESKFKRGEAEIEKDLPEFIDNLVSNLKGGISLEKALLKSVRSEQKALLAEVTLINQKVMMGANVHQALREFRLRFDSQIINRTFFLIEEGIRSGGNLAAPLERISENLKRIYNLEAEIRANSGGFSVVIKGITVLVAPVLFALAITLLTFIGNLFQLIAKSGAEFLSVSELPVEFSEYLVTFSYAMIILITFFSSLITSELKNEKIHDSIKYLPIYVILAILIYNIAAKVLLGFFGNVI